MKVFGAYEDEEGWVVLHEGSEDGVGNDASVGIE